DQEGSRSPRAPGASSVTQEEESARSGRTHPIPKRVRSQGPAEAARVILVDTSVWLEVFGDRSGANAKKAALEGALDREDSVLTRFNQLELLQGARDERGWSLL